MKALDATTELNTESLTDKQFWLAGRCAVNGHPRVLADTGEKRVARNLEKLGWGAVEDGAGEDQIFRLNQAGEDAFAWLRRWCGRAIDRGLEE